MGLVVERAVEWHKVFALILFDADARQCQSRFFPSRKRELAQAREVYERVVKRDGRCVEVREARVRRT
jgi:hypothetical protein